MAPQGNMLALVRRIQPRDTELAQARQHRQTIRTRLESSFDVNRMIAIGSHARGTAIRSYSDLDVLFVLRRNEAKWGGRFVSSSTLLGRVQRDLQGRFPQTDIRRDQQAAVVNFAAGQQGLDVVPAIFDRMDGPRPIFAIPDGIGGWLGTSPEAHNRYFAESDERSGGKLKRVCQLLRWWKHSRARPIPIQSFHLDILLASTNICVGVKPYTHCLYGAFQHLLSRTGAGFRDPLGIAGVIPAANSDAQREVIVRALEGAADRSKTAVAAEAVGDSAEANRQWSMLFNDEY